VTRNRGANKSADRCAPDTLAGMARTSLAFSSKAIAPPSACACTGQDFAGEEIAVRGFYRLSDLQLGHAVQNSRCLRPVFYQVEAVEFLRHAA